MNEWVSEPATGFTKTMIPVDGLGEVEATFTNEGHVHLSAYSDSVPVSYRKGSLTYHDEHWYLSAHLWEVSGWQMYRDAARKDHDTMSTNSREKDRSMPRTWAAQLENILSKAVRVYISANPQILAVAERTRLTKSLNDTTAHIKELRTDLAAAVKVRAGLTARLEQLEEL